MSSKKRDRAIWRYIFAPHVLHFTYIFTDFGQIECKPCPEGHYTDTIKQESCKPCSVANKKYTEYVEGAENIGATECKTVIVGHYIQVSQSDG